MNHSNIKIILLFDLKESIVFQNFKKVQSFPFPSDRLCPRELRPLLTARIGFVAVKGKEGEYFEQGSNEGSRMIERIPLLRTGTRWARAGSISLSKRIQRERGNNVRARLSHSLFLFSSVSPRGGEVGIYTSVEPTVVWSQPLSSPPPFHRLSSQLLDPPLIFQRSQQASINREIFVTSCQRRKKDFITRNTPHISFFFPNESRLSTRHIRIHRIARWVILFFHTSVASRTSSSQLHSKPSCYTYREWRSVVLFARKIRLIPCLLCFSCFLCFFITEKVRIPFK